MITTDLLSRGFDMPSIQLVINFDVPMTDGFTKADYETYLHRIGRAGRFGKPGVAVTLFDQERDEAAFFDIVEKYKFDKLVQKLDSPNQVGELIDEINSVM